LRGEDKGGGEVDHRRGNYKEKIISQIFSITFD